MNKKFGLVLILLGVSISMMSTCAQTAYEDDEQEQYMSSCTVRGGACGCSQRTRIKKVPYIITEPGSYRLCRNLVADECGQPGITIAVSDVELDLCGFFIEGGAPSIDVKKNLINVTIHNGSILASETDGIHVAEGCSNVHIFDLTLLDGNRGHCKKGKAGIYFQGTAQNGCSECLVNDVHVSCYDGGGIRFEECSQACARNCTVSSIVSSTLLDSVGYYASGLFIVFDHCVASNIVANHQDRSGFGFFIEAANSTWLRDCKALCNTSFAPSEQLFGFYVLSSDCTTLERCISSNNVAHDAAAGVGAQAPLSAGFRSKDSAKTVARACIACGNTSDALGDGFNVEGDTSTCISHGISVGNTTDGVVVFSNSTACSFGENKAIGNGTLGFHCHGFMVPRSFKQMITRSPSICLFYSNFAAANLIPYEIDENIMVLGDPDPTAGVNLLENLS